MGVLQEDSEYLDRTSFLIDPNGIIQKIYREVEPETHAAEVMVDLQKLQTI